MIGLLSALTWPEWRAHPWRQGVALLAVALGVALAFSVQLINGSALDEFGSAVRSLDGAPDLSVRAANASSFGGPGFAEALYAQLARDPRVAGASPVVEATANAVDEHGKTLTLRVLGVDAFAVAAIAPGLSPRPDDGVDRMSVIDPGSVFLNASARSQLGAAKSLALQTPHGPLTLKRAGSVEADGPPLVVMDIAGAQQAFGSLGHLQRVDLRLRTGVSAASVVAGLALPPDVRLAQPDEANQRMANLSRAYRVNLTVLALVALFTGAFLVFSVMALSVARRVPQFALLGVLGLSARDRLKLVMVEGALLGVAGSAIGLAGGAALAAAALHFLGGDLGGGYFQGLSPTLHWSWGAAAIYGALGVAAAMVGAWVPARQAALLAPAQALKGLGLDAARGAPVWAGPALLLVAIGLCALPPIDGLAIAAYLGVAAGLVGGILCVPGCVGLLVRLLPTPHHAMALLAVERARGERAQASVAVAGVVASLSLGVALTVMVGSFRTAVDDWLQQLLPADLYVRDADANAASGDALLPPTLASAAARLPGVSRVQGQRVLPVMLDPRQPSVMLLARPVPADVEKSLPLVGPLVDAPPGSIAVFASEAMASLYGARAGGTIRLPIGGAAAGANSSDNAGDGNGASASASARAGTSAGASAGAAGTVTVFVRSLWRDYARQNGTVLIDLADYRRLTGDNALTDMALWLAPGANVAAVESGLRTAAGAAAPLDMATTSELRTLSLRLFDRSFAVTTYLQAVAIAIGLFGIAASFSSQVLARRKEFGMLAHLGVTRGQVLGLVAAEGAVWTGAGALLGLVLGLGVSVVLVKVVNPQSFHWTMDMTVPWLRLVALCAAVLAAGTVTATLAGRAAAGRGMALAVKEDW